ncbi:hypothetical protein RN001_006554 [Aquatica leii]|uniref:Peptidase S1 domain-containing protein n=1 Tax=Aquatica leii TaxID=1421715 RepID=A0AAN7Q8X7_9COLE|nr:hypothetical protein RN001_006554 [Aquatica leii]
MKTLLTVLLILSAFKLYLFQSSVTGGRTALNGEFPYQVSIRHNGIHICSGSIIDKITILTAAHCIHNKVSSMLSVSVGSVDVSLGYVYEVSNQIIHDQYDPQKSLNDIALLKLHNPVQYTMNTQPVALATQRIPSGVNCVAMGWGFDVKPMYSKYLQRIDLKTIDTDACKKSYTSNSTFPVTDTNICTMIRVGHGTCHGDTGGPLISYGQQIGIVSWEYTCNQNLPGVHTRVSPYLEWIKSKTK